MNTTLKKYINWAQVGAEPTQDGTYYVMGEGITGVRPMKWSNGKWDAQPGEDPWVHGTLASENYSFIRTTTSKITGLTPAQKKKAHLDDVHQITSMIGEPHNAGDAVDIVDAVLYNDGTLKYFWHNLDSVKDDTVMYFFGELDASLEAKLAGNKTTANATHHTESQSSLASKASAPVEKPEPATQPEPVVESDPLPDSLNDDAPAQADTEGEDSMEDLPF